MAIDKIQSESINLADTFAFTGTVTGAGGVNTPSFRAYSASTQTMSNNTVTKAVFGTEDFDTNSDFASSRFTPTVAGTYFVFTQLNIGNDSVADVVEYGLAQIFKNTTSIAKNIVDQKNSAPSNQVACYCGTLVAMNGSSDYLEVFGQSAATSGTATIASASNQTWFGAYKIII